MSLINDALKRASQNPPTPSEPPVIPPRLEMKPMEPMPPAASAPGKNSSRLIPVLVVLLILGAVAVAGWNAIHHSTRTPAAETPPVTAAKPAVTLPATTPPTPPPAEAPAAVAAAAAPVAPVEAAPAPAQAPTPAPAPTPVKPVFNPEDAPRLQGIFYVPGKSTALIADKSVRVGDRILGYRVQEIGQASVTLVNAAGKPVVLTLDN